MLRNKLKRRYKRCCVKTWFYWSSNFTLRAKNEKEKKYDETIESKENRSTGVAKNPTKYDIMNLKKKKKSWIIMGVLTLERALWDVRRCNEGCVRGED